MARIRRPLGTASPNTISEASTAPKKPDAQNNTKKRKSTASSESSTVTPEPAPVSKKPRTSTQPTTSKAQSKATSDPPILDVSAIVRTGDSYEAIIHDCISSPVPVYDTCDTIRRKIRAFLSSAHEPPITQAAFLRAITKATYGPKSTKTIQSATLSAFMKKKGPLAGNTSTVYYAAYCFFEKLRVKEKKPKSKDREVMEELWGAEGGVDTKTVAGSVKLIGSASTGSHYAFDKYGRPRSVW